MTIDTAKLRALAEAATPGPWRYGIDIDQLSDGGSGYPLDYYPDCRTVVEISCRECGERSDITEADAAFIAAANPATVIALLDEIDTLRRFLDAEKEQVTRMGADNVRRMQRLGVKYPSGLDSGIDALEQQLAAMTAARDEACEIAEDATFAGSLRDGARKRITELRKIGGGK